MEITVLVSATFLEVAANFAANAIQSPGARVLSRIAPLVVLVLLSVVIVGQVVVHRRTHPPAPRPAWDPQATPYPGLAAFGRQDASVFFGREAEVGQIVRRLNTSATDPRERFVCVTGMSGSGKSSLLHAGVLPRLLRSRWTVLPTVVPGPEPLERLADSLTQPDGRERAETVRRLRAGDLAGVRGTRTPGSVLSGRTLLVIDQLEELITFAPDADREAFLAAVSAALAHDRRLWVVATLRVEFLQDFLTCGQPQLFASPMALGAMSTAELVAAVEQPARLAGVTFEPGLVARIVDDTGTADALPLLGYLLRELYLSIGDSRVATKESYLSLGGVAGALACQADEVFATVVDQHGADSVLGVLLRLVGMEAGEPVKRRVPLTALSDQDREILRPFDKARLLVVAQVDTVPMVQVAHEALFRQWPPLHQQVAVRAERLNSRSELERWAADWRSSGRSPDYLLTGDRLALARRWLSALEPAGEATSDMRELVTASRSRDRAFLHQVSESVGRYVLTNTERDPELGTLLAATVLAECPPTATAVRALMAALAHNHTQAVLTGHRAGVRAIAWSPDGTWIVTGSLDGTARIWNAATGAPAAVLTGHTSGVVGVHWSPDSRHVATASRDRTARVWEALSGQAVAVLTAFGDTVREVAWSPDGTRLATCSRDRRIRLFDTASWQQTEELSDHRNEIYRLAWSPDGTRLVSAAYDRTCIVWTMETGRPEQVLERSNNHATPVSWTPDGSCLVSAVDHRISVLDSRTGRVRRTFPELSELVTDLRCSPRGDSFAVSSRGPEVHVRSLDHGGELVRLCGHTDRVQGLAWSPDGGRLATCSEDGTARIWTMGTRSTELRQTAGHPGPVVCVGVSPDGGHIAVGSGHDLSVRRTDDGQSVKTLTGHTAVVNDLRWSPDGRRLASCADDNTVRIWGALDSDEQRTLFTGHETVEAVAWSPDGTRLAVAGRDHRATVLDAATGADLGQYGEHSQWVCALAWSPTGTMLATGSDDHTAQIWDVSDRRLLHRLKGHQSWVDAVAWSPDGALLATSSGDWTIRVWDTATGGLQHLLKGHEARVRGLAWSPDGSRIATGSDDHTVRLWNPLDGGESRVIGIHRDRCSSVAWLPDSRRVVSGSEDRTTRVWAAEGDVTALLSAARERIFRSLTAEERRTHLLPENGSVSAGSA
ncbi:WD40 repeat domain-containing protein [Streptomyces sp. NPDC005648]|uniref:nSTAND1 domain-containing NTPase n=1 Tax=Streptomyces sp. NPDC005648 TaxID=3157044 RepID=UPI00339F1AD0